jgi:hypothetical protein
VKRKPRSVDAYQLILNNKKGGERKAHLFQLMLSEAYPKELTIRRMR